MNDSTKSHGLWLQRNIVMAIRIEDFQTDIGTCLPIRIVILMFLNMSSGIQIDSKSKTARILKSFWSSVYWIMNESSLSKSVSWSSYAFFAYICFTRSLHLTKWRSRFPDFCKYVSQVGQRKALKSGWILSTQQMWLLNRINWIFFWTFLMLRRASIPTIAPSIRSMSYIKILIRTIPSTDGISTMQTPGTLKGQV